MNEITAAIQAALQTETDENTRLRLKAAQATINGDLVAAQQLIAAAAIPSADWAKAKEGSLEY